MTELFADAGLTRSSDGGFVLNFTPLDVTASLNYTFATVDGSGGASSVVVNSDGWTWLGTGVVRFADDAIESSLVADEFFATLAPDQGVRELEPLLPPGELPSIRLPGVAESDERYELRALAFEPIDLATLLAGESNANPTAPASAPPRPVPTKPLDGVVRFASHDLLLDSRSAARNGPTSEAAPLSRGWAFEVAAAGPEATEAAPVLTPVEEVRSANGDSTGDVDTVEEDVRAEPAAAVPDTREESRAATSPRDPTDDARAIAAIDAALAVDLTDGSKTAWVAWTQPRCALAAATLAVLAIERMRDRSTETEIRCGLDAARTSPRRGEPRQRA